MNEVFVEQVAAGEKQIRFEVSVDIHKYNVTLSKDYWQKLTGGKITPQEMVKKSFEFLLEREGPESILREFDLTQITTYFPDFEQTLRNSL